MSKPDGLDIGDRMKCYEKITESHLTKRVPAIIRIDGRAFHTITRRRYKKSWSDEFLQQMVKTAQHVKGDMSGCDFLYSQSDEISFLLTDYRMITTQGWFDYDVRKMISISASLASAHFSRIYGIDVSFDSRCFSIPKDDVCNYFIWRQVDATRNAIQMLGREHFSHKQLHNKSCAAIQEILFDEKGINFNDCETVRKRGFCITKDGYDTEIPVFTQDRSYIENHVYIRED